MSSSTQGLLEENKITTNKITTNRIELNKITTNKITTNKITTNRYTINKITTNQLILTPDGRELLAYLVQCAIPQEVTLEAVHEGVRYEFPGDIGLAPKWVNRALRSGEQRWVSACLLSRVNRFGISVPISIRGPHPALTVTQEEAEEFSREEGAFYGNIFTPIDDPLIWHACRGRDEARYENGPLDLRDCAERDPANPALTLCGFDYEGDCADWSRPRNAYACKRFREPDDHDCDDDDHRHDDGDRRHDDDDEYHGGYYEDCHDAPGEGQWPGAERFDQVITVFVKP